MEGYSVILAINGIEALKEFRSANGTIDLIVLDVMLPELSGFDVCEEIRKEKKNSR